MKKSAATKVSREYCESIRSAIPAHLRADFTVRACDGSAVVDYARHYASAEHRRNDCYDARVALESAGYRIAESYGSLTVFPPLPEPERCELCGAPTPPACRCRDLVTE
jgi:hypothetical protein